MAAQSVTLELRRDSNASSAMSQPSTNTETRMQGKILEEESPRQQQAVAADTEMVDHHDDEIHTSTEPALDDQAENTSGEEHSLNLPIRRWRARDIEAALKLTAAQAREFHNVVRDAMREAGLLGTMEGACDKLEYQEGLQHVISATKDQVEFLQAGDIPVARLNELILARARINNDNEKHNERLVKTGRVNARAGTSRPTSGPTPEIEERGSSPQRSTGRTDSPIASRTRSASHPQGHTVTSARPSVILETISSMSIEEHPIETIEESCPAPANASLSAALSTRPPPTAPVFTTSIFHPTAFLIRMIHSTTGVAIHTSQLASAARRTSGSVLELHDMNYATFLDMASNAVGFRVEARIEAVIPSNMGTAVLRQDTFVRLEGEENWFAVLQMWTNARKRTCEFIVDRGVDAVDE